MTTYPINCPWCDQLAPVAAFTRKAYCPTCGHRTDERKDWCDCPPCLSFAEKHDAPTVEIDAAAVRAAFAEAVTART